MMGFREFAKSQYDTIKLRDPALREEKEVFLYPYVKALYWHRVAHELYKVTLFPMIVVSPMTTPCPWSMKNPSPICAPG